MILKKLKMLFMWHFIFIKTKYLCKEFQQLKTLTICFFGYFTFLWSVLPIIISLTLSLTHSFTRTHSFSISPLTTCFKDNTEQSTSAEKVQSHVKCKRQKNNNPFNKANPFTKTLMFNTKSCSLYKTHTVDSQSRYLHKICGMQT